MKKAEPEMRPEYDFSGGKRGRYAKRYSAGTNLVLLDPDVAKSFPDSESVNAALRILAKAAETRRAGGRSKKTVR